MRRKDFPFTRHSSSLSRTKSTSLNLSLWHSALHHNVEASLTSLGKHNLLTVYSDSQERLSFLTVVATKVNNPNSQDAYVYATVAVATVKLELKDLDGARKELDKAEKILDSFDSVETIVHAAFYRVNAQYYQVRTLVVKVEYSLTLCSPNLTSHRTTRMHSFTLLVSTSMTLLLPNEGVGHMI